MKTLSELANMEGEQVWEDLFEEGGPVVYFYKMRYWLYEVPLYGGQEMYCNNFATLEEAKKVVEAWT